MNHEIAIAAGACSAAAAGLIAYATFAPSSGFFAPVIAHGSRGRPAVALTFDDGPLPGSTDKILDVLKSARIRAAFFVIGRYVVQYPSLLRRIHDEGHLIGNHSFDHHRGGLFHGVGYWHDQVARTDLAVAAAAGITPTMFRPPMGFKSPLLARAVRTKSIIAWSLRCYDGVAASPERIASRALRATPGDIILLHDGRDPVSRRDPSDTTRALPVVIRALRDRGLDFLRVDELIA